MTPRTAALKKSPRMQTPDGALGEELLYAAATAGDARAWEALYDGAYEPLARYVRWRLGGRRGAADEVIQETWLTAVRLFGRFEPRRGSFSQWLRGIAANALRNHLRRESLRRKKNQTLDETLHTTNGPAKEHSEDECERIAVALADLPDHYEDVLRAKYVDGQSVAQIAAAREQTSKAIESLLTRAREAFRAAYNRADPD